LVKTSLFRILDEYLSSIYLMKNTNVSSKDSDLISSIETHFQGQVNLARVVAVQKFYNFTIKNLQHPVYQVLFFSQI